MKTDDNTTRFRPIKGYPGYAIGETGEVISFRRHGCKILKPDTNCWGYLTYDLRSEDGSFKRQKAHVLVAQAFLGERPEGMVVDHIDGNKLNNHYTNLRYCTQKENINNPSTAQNNIVFRKRRAVWAIKDGVEMSFESCNIMCKELGLNSGTVYKCLSSKYPEQIHHGYTFRYKEAQ